MFERFQCWKTKPKTPTIVENLVVNYRFSEPLPETDVELFVIEHAIARRMSVVNRQIQKTNEDYSFCMHVQNLRQALHHTREKSKLQEELQTLSMKFMEVTEKRNSLMLSKQA
jgi:hypothetical protein